MSFVSFLRPRIAGAAKSRCRLMAIAALSCCMFGCSAAYNARTVNSSDWKYGATCYIRGAMGRSYLSDTKKKIVVSIFALSPDAKARSEREEKEALAAGVWRGPGNPGATVTATDPVLFRKEYSLRASDLEWSSAWGDQDTLSITFYDYGPGVEVPYSSRDVAPKRVLQTLNYRFDSGLGSYKEQISKQ